MKRDKAIAIFWLFFGILIAEESYRLKLGSFGRPNSGLYPFLVGLLIVLFSLIMLVQKQSTKSEREGKGEKLNYRNILSCLLSLYGYALVFEWFGFIPSTFLLVVFFLKFIERKGWALVITASLLTSIVSYVFFEIWLRAALPKGILRI